MLLSSSDESESGANKRLVRTWEVDFRVFKLMCKVFQRKGSLTVRGADITIMGGEILAAVAKLQKHDLMKPDKIPWNYNQRPFKLDGIR